MVPPTVQRGLVLYGATTWRLRFVLSCGGLWHYRWWGLCNSVSRSVSLHESTERHTAFAKRVAREPLSHSVPIPLDVMADSK